MKNKYYETKEFRSLEREWYQRLEERGFQDIEDTTRHYRPLKAWHSYRFTEMAIVQREAREIYFEKAKELLHSFAFASEVQKEIWRLHTEGLSKRKIESAISGREDAYKREMIGIIIARIASNIR